MFAQAPYISWMKSIGSFWNNANSLREVNDGGFICVVVGLPMEVSRWIEFINRIIEISGYVSWDSSIEYPVFVVNPVIFWSYSF